MLAIYLSLLGTLFFVYMFFRMKGIRNRVHLIRKELQDILDVLEPVALIDKNGKILRVNTQYANLVNVNFRSIIGQTTKAVFGDNQPEEQTKLIALAFQGNRVQKIRKHSFIPPANNPFLADTRKILFDIEYHPVKLGTEMHIIKICRNVTYLYEVQETLMAQKQQLEEKGLELKANNLELNEIRDQLQEALDEQSEEMEYAREIQEGLLPTQISIPNVNSWVYYEPIQSVGGDFYDIIKIDDSRYGILISDVAGHGLAAAFVGALAKMSLTVHAKKTNSAKKLMQILNENLCSVLNSGHYLTAFYGILDLKDNSFTYTRASHPSPVLRRADGTFEQLDTKGLFVGIFPDPKYEEKKVYLGKGDKLLFFTDGAFEYVEDENTKVLYKDFLEIIKKFAHLPLDQILLHTSTEITTRIGAERGNDDDVTFLAIEIAKDSREERMNYLIRFNNEDKPKRKRISNEEEGKKLLHQLDLSWDEVGFSSSVTHNMSECILYCLREWSDNWREAIMVAWCQTGVVFKITLVNTRKKDNSVDKESWQAIFLAKTYMDEVYLDSNEQTLTLIKRIV